MTDRPRRPDHAALGRELLDASLLRGDFVLSSGARSDYYLDKYRRVLGILAVVDREEGGQARITEAGYEYAALFTRSELGI